LRVSLHQKTNATLHHQPKRQKKALLRTGREINWPRLIDLKEISLVALALHFAGLSLPTQQILLLFISTTTSEEEKNHY